MRPPDLPGGNPREVRAQAYAGSRASMRPPDLPGGNNATGTVTVTEHARLQ